MMRHTNTNAPEKQQLRFITISQIIIKKKKVACSQYHHVNVSVSELNNSCCGDGGKQADWESDKNTWLR